MRPLATGVIVALVISVAACGRPDQPPRDSATAPPPGPSEFVVALGFMVGEPHVVAASPGHLMIWDTERKQVVRRQKLDGSSLRLDSTLTPDGRYLVFNRRRPGAETQYDTVLLNVRTGSTTTLAPEAGASGRFALSEDGTTLTRVTRVEGAGPVHVHIWRLPSGEPRATASFETTAGYAVQAAASPTGDRVAVGFHRTSRENPNPTGPKGQILICDVATGRVLATIDAPDIPGALEFSADGAQLYWGTSSDAQVHVADAVTGSVVAVFGDPPDPAVVYRGRGGVPGAVQLMAVTPTWTHMLTSRLMDSTVRIWNPASRTLVHSVTIDGRVRSIATSLDGRQFAVGLPDAKVSLYDMQSPSAPLQSFSIR